MNIAMFTPIALMLIFEIKHFICDYPLQTEYMLGKFKSQGWEAPLAAHCGVHATATFLITLAFFLFFTTHTWALPLALILAGIDFGAHFLMDRIKAAPDLLGKYESLSKREWKRVKEISLKDDTFGTLAKKMLDDNRRFWINVGIDQMVHQFTSLVIVILMLL